MKNNQCINIRSQDNHNANTLFLYRTSPFWDFTEGKYAAPLILILILGKRDFDFGKNILVTRTCMRACMRVCVCAVLHLCIRVILCLTDFACLFVCACFCLCVHTCCVLWRCTSALPRRKSSVQFASPVSTSSRCVCVFVCVCACPAGLPCSSSGVFFHRFSCSVLVYGSRRVCLCLCLCLCLPCFCLCRDLVALRHLHVCVCVRAQPFKGLLAVARSYGRLLHATKSHRPVLGTSDQLWGGMQPPCACAPGIAPALATSKPHVEVKVFVQHGYLWGPRFFLPNKACYARMSWVIALLSSRRLQQQQALAKFQQPNATRSALSSKHQVVLQLCLLDVWRGLVMWYGLMLMEVCCRSGAGV